MNDYNIKYIDRSTHKTYIILKDNHNKYNYNNFKNNIYAALFNNEGVVYKYAFVCGEVFLVIFLIKIIIKGIGILGVKIIKFGCYVKKCWNKKK